LRKHFTDAQYCGIELEINQHWVMDRAADYPQRVKTILKTIGDIIE
jgi:hypothetical protein